MNLTVSDKLHHTDLTKSTLSVRCGLNSSVSLQPEVCWDVLGPHESSVGKNKSGALLWWD